MSYPEDYQQVKEHSSVPAGLICLVLVFFTFKKSCHRDFEDMFYLSGSLIRAALNNTLTCFLIDDDIDDQEIFSTVLGAIAPAANYVVAVNGQAALEMLISGLFSPDVIFLDLNMPLMNGRQFFQEVNRLRILQDVPIVVLTTSADANTKAAMLEAGAKDFITKPDRFSQWEQVLRRALGNYL